MNKIIIVFAFILGLVFVQDGQAQGEEKGKKELKAKAEKGRPNGKAFGNQEITIQTSAQCGMCKERIEKALLLEKGVKQATLNLENKALRIVFNGNQTNAAALRTAIAKTGYDADDVPAVSENYQKLPACCKKDGGH
ncbi:MAG: heavy-metal-associated domain-containing protein [Microscillaceae bacterium]|nr:heavy-metal-associated domain-containing protein [Microscillaceae bacterium]